MKRSETKLYVDMFDVWLLQSYSVQRSVMIQVRNSFSWQQSPWPAQTPGHGGNSPGWGTSTVLDIHSLRNSWNKVIIIWTAVTVRRPTYRNGRESRGVWEPQQLRMDIIQELGISNLGAPTTAPTNKKTWNIFIFWTLDPPGLDRTEHFVWSLQPLTIMTARWTTKQTTFVSLSANPLLVEKRDFTDEVFW